jgi:hypothetical protein
MTQDQKDAFFEDLWQRCTREGAHVMDLLEILIDQKDVFYTIWEEEEYLTKEDVHRMVIEAFMDGLRNGAILGDAPVHMVKVQEGYAGDNCVLFCTGELDKIHQRFSERLDAFLDEKKTEQVVNE